MKADVRSQKSETRVQHPAARSYLDCGSPLLLSHPRADRTRPQSARGLAQSKTWRCFVVSLVFLAHAIIVHEQSYSIEWFTIDGGDGTSTGGVYSIGLTLTGAWSQVSFPYATNTTDISITVPTPTGNRLYRLRSPSCWVALAESPQRRARRIRSIHEGELVREQERPRRLPPTRQPPMG